MFQHDYTSTWMPIQDFQPILPIPNSLLTLLEPHTPIFDPLFLFAAISGVYFQSIMAMCTVSVIMTVMVLNFHHRKPEMCYMPSLVM